MKLQFVVTTASLGVLAGTLALMAFHGPRATAAPLAATAPLAAASNGVSYCTAGTSTNGCVATMSCSGIPSAAALSGFVLTTSGVEGLKRGLIRYSVSGQVATPWGSASSSFLCIKAPQMKLGPGQNSGGTLGACDGVIQVDFLSYMASTGSTLVPGTTFYVQTFYTDPPAIKGISLSDALMFTIVP